MPRTLSVASVPSFVPAQRAREMSFERTVPRTLVHRASVNEVFVTDGSPVGPGRALIAAQWPRTHALFHPCDRGHSDPLLLVETFRQAGIYAAHRYNEVPLGHHFVFCDLDIDIVDPSALKTGGLPLQVILDGTYALDPDKPVTPHRSQARFTAEVEVAGRPCARISGGLIVLSPRAYRALRARRPGRDAPEAALPPEAAPVAAALVGRTDPQNVLLSVLPDAPRGEFLLRLDPDHAGYFEHACDHVPGVALIEAFRQAAHLTAQQRTGGPVLLSTATIAFDRYAELEAPVTFTLEEPAPPRPDGHRSRLTATQGGTAVGHADLVHIPAPGASA
ncbi:hypothetical protein ACVW0K_003753 [Streptomyces filamentosus]